MNSSASAELMVLMLMCAGCPVACAGASCLLHRCGSSSAVLRLSDESAEIRRETSLQSERTHAAAHRSAAQLTGAGDQNTPDAFIRHTAHTRLDIIKSLFCSPGLHLFDQKYIQTVKYYYNVKQLFSM